MYPTLIEVGGVAISSFSVMVLIAFLVGHKISEIELKRKGKNSDLAEFLLAAYVIGGLVGAKILFLYQQATLEAFLNEPARYLSSGFTFLGGFVGALILIWVVARYKNLSFFFVTDTLAPALIIAYGVGRIGCLLVGDDYGIPTDLPWAVSFPNGSPPTNEQVHPTQIYDTLMMIGIFIVFWKIRKNDFPVGWITGIGLIVLGLQRFLIEFIRNTTPSFIPGLSQAQLISLVLVLLGLLKLMEIGIRTDKTSEIRD